MKPLLYGICIVLVSLWVKLEAPWLIRGAIALFSRGPAAEDQVMEVQGNTLSLQTSDDHFLKVHLVGLATPSARWQAEETGVIAMLVQNNPVMVQCVSQCQLGQTEEALLSLPNGTLLQTIVLADGVAQLDPQKLKQLPHTVAIALETAQTLAQSQHKNIWGS